MCELCGNKHIWTVLSSPLSQLKFPYTFSILLMVHAANSCTFQSNKYLKYLTMDLGKFILQGLSTQILVGHKRLIWVSQIKVKPHMIHFSSSFLHPFCIFIYHKFISHNLWKMSKLKYFMLWKLKHILFCLQ